MGLVPGGRVVERAVGLDVRDPRARRGGDLAQAGELVGQLGAQGPLIDVDEEPAEVLGVLIRDMSPDPHPELGRHLANVAHRGVVTGVSPAGDVRARDQAQQGVVVTHALAEVGIQVDAGTHPTMIPPRPASASAGSGSFPQLHPLVDPQDSHT